MKKFIAMLLALVMVLSLVACGDKKEDAGTNDSDKDSQDTITLKMHFVDPETAPFVQGGKKIRLTQPQQLMASEREIVEEAYAGDIIGVFDPGIFSIGDTICDPKLRVRFDGIPTFAPEHFSVISQVDTMKRKQFVKGVTQIAQEGAIQIFHEPNSGMEEVIVGAVGVLQFEVLEYRLKNEYNIDIRRRDLSYSYIRWITSEGTDPTALNLASDTKWVQDFRGHNLLIFNNEWSIRWAEQKNPDLTLAEFSRNW